MFNSLPAQINTLRHFTAAITVTVIIPSLVPRIVLWHSRQAILRIASEILAYAISWRIKLTIDLKSFSLFPLVSMTNSYLKKESDHKSSLHCCIMMKLVFKQVFSPLWFCFLLSLRNNLFTCPAFLFLLSVSSLYFLSSISCIQTYTLVPASVLAKWATLNPDPFLTG